MSDVKKNDPPAANEDIFNQVLGEYYRFVGRGEEVDREAFLRDHPEIARQLQDHWNEDGAIRSYASSPDDSDFSVCVEVPPLEAIRHFGDYELLDELGRGGMGIVYLARNKKRDYLCAVKMMLAGEHAADVDVQRFTHEATAAAQLRHENIVAIHEVSEFDNRHYIAMEYVAGGSLSDRLKEAPLSADESAKLVATIGEAVHFAHGEGIIHRDLKPANVLFDREGRPKIGDFGLARQLDVDSDLTRTGQILGTPSYMSPEQAGGDTAPPTPAQDVYSLGATFYAALTGRPPF